MQEYIWIQALKGGFREKVTLSTKFGLIFSGGKWEVRGDPSYVRSACEASLKRLDTDYIDLYYQDRVDTRVPIEVTVCFFSLSLKFFFKFFFKKLFEIGSFLWKMGELKKLVEEGKIKYVGLSEASASTIRRAHSVHPLTAVQVEWSLWSRDAEKDIISTCRFFFSLIYNMYNFEYQII